MPSVQNEPVILDLSKWNASINTTILKANAHACILRCQYGTMEDIKFREFRDQLNAAGIPWTPYLFWLANIDPVKQINLFKELTGHVDQDGRWVFDGKFGAWMDIEETTRPVLMSKAKLLSEWTRFVELFYQMTGLQVGVYTRQSWWDSNMLDTSLPAGLPVFLWVANWGTNTPILPKDWARKKLSWEIHQHSGDKNKLGAKFGVGSSSVDLNNYRSGITEFNMIYGLDLKTLAGNLTGKPFEAVEVAAKTLYLRNSPKVDETTVVGTTTQGKVFYPDGIVTDEQGKPWYFIGKHKRLFLAAWLTRELN